MDEASADRAASVERFAAEHGLPPRWIEVKRQINRLVEKPDFWYQDELRDQARILAGEASEILHAATHPEYKPRTASHENQFGPPEESDKAVLSDEEQWMRRALMLARAAAAAGDVPVGSVVVRGSEIVAEGTESVKASRDVSAHSELIAVREACRKLGSFDLSGCTLITTAEPCFMCSYVVRRTGISRVVVGASVAAVGGASSRHPVLTDPEIPVWGRPPEVVFGVLEQECRALRP